jgi:hypothetical protein
MSREEGLFRDAAGRYRPGCMATWEIIRELEAEPQGSDRFAALAAEACRRAARGAFPKARVPEAVLFGVPGVIIGEVIDSTIFDVPPASGP